MKKFLFILLVIVLSMSIQKSYSWDSEAAKFYPLAVGNSWSYLFRNYNGQFGCAFPTETYNYIISITKDTLINGHKYYKFSNNNLIRIDSATMKVYKFLGSGECMTDSLLAKKNNTVQSCDMWGTISDTNLVMFAGQNRRTMNLQSIGYSRRLMYEIGVYYNGGCELNMGYTHQLNGCIINGIQYGQMLGVNQTGAEIPNNFSLFQNYPNPFNPITKLRFQMPKSGMAKLVVFDLLGRESKHW